MTTVLRYIREADQASIQSNWAPASWASLLLMLYVVVRIVLELAGYFSYDILFENPLVSDPIKDAVEQHVFLRLLVLFVGLMVISCLRFVGLRVYATLMGLLTVGAVHGTHYLTLQL